MRNKKGQLCYDWRPYISVEPCSERKNSVN